MRPIVVIGSINIDLSIDTPRLPAEGETLLGGNCVVGFGGKGANQAVAAARLGGSVTMTGAVGDDPFAQPALNQLERMGIAIDHVKRVDGASTGLAPIFLLPSGQNAIVVAPGANMHVTPDDIESMADELFEECPIVVVQNEIPFQTTRTALELAKSRGCLTIYNPAPAPEHVPEEVLANCWLLCLNEIEAGQLSGDVVTDDTTDDELLRIAAKLVVLGVQNVVITLGARGCLVHTHDGESFRIPTRPIQHVVDTTGAGDCFIGSLALFLAMGRTLRQAAVRATYVASDSVQRAGTQSSYPRREDLPASLFSDL